MKVDLADVRARIVSPHATHQPRARIEEVVLFKRFPGVPPPSINLITRGVSGDAPKSVLELAAQGPATNVSRCSADPRVGEATVWRQSFRGCAPNSGIVLPSTRLFGLIRDHDFDPERESEQLSSDPAKAPFLRWEFVD